MARDTAGDKDEGLYFNRDTKATEGAYCCKNNKELPESEGFQDRTYLFTFNSITFKSSGHDCSTIEHQMNKPGYFCVSKR